MKHRSIFIFTATAFLIIGCTANTPADEQSAVTVQKVEQEEQAIKPEASSTPMPNGKSILADIYKQPVGEITGSQLGDGRYVSFWNGHQFTLDGKNYFVGFSEATPESEIEYPAPEDMVTISQATYELVGNAWMLKAVQHDVGKFGGKNKAPAVDAIQKTAVFHSPQGKFVLATPAVTTANGGIQMFFYEIFSFSPVNVHWKYVGHVDAGYENSGSCAHEADASTQTKCVKSTGNLFFSANENSSWPELNVVFQGTELGEDGNVISLTDKDSITYRYDEKSSKYLPINRI